MTYCCGMLLKDGLLMVTDTRTNAGVDNISVFKKLHTVEGDDRFLVLATAGNLSVTQSVLSHVTAPPVEGGPLTLHDVADIFTAARLVGDTAAEVKGRIASAIEPEVSAGVTILFGGQIRDQPMRFFLIYGEGNFIECEQDSPFLLAGETKYGKPILLRSVTYDSDLYDALKIVLLSFDSTIRSNLAVGLPLDLLVLKRDALKPELVHRIEPDEPYFHDLGDRWSVALKESVAAIPAVPYKSAEPR
jgi:putative proteasome-type protease